MTSETWAQRLFRPGASSSREIRLDLLLLAGCGLILVGTGIGLRDPWPADEPRFALVARDMLLSGDWLLPRVGGEPYADKPPLYFWIMAMGMMLTQSVRFAFLLPSLLSALGCVALVYDLGRRLWNREAGLAAALALLCTVQFVWQARQAQIDVTLCFWTTLSLYGLLRHLLLGPHWRWYSVGWFAAGLGVITKGVGFLPLLVLLPFAVLRDARWSPRLRTGVTLRWLFGPLAFLVAIAIWLVPMLLAARTDPVMAAYRDEILFLQTVQRYTDAWHHREPVWYFLIEVIPWAWLPVTLLLPWLVRRWRDDWCERDLRIALLLSWVVLVVVFFSLSTGKRGIYVLPAVPAVALACAPHITWLIAQRTAQRAMFFLAAGVSVACVLALILLAIQPERRSEILTAYGIDVFAPLLLITALAAVACVIARPRRGPIAFASVLVSVLLVVSFWVNPVLNENRSGAAFAARVEELADPAAELGLVAFKEQYLLSIRREVVHFGHARWRQWKQEAADAARWLADSPTRQLVVSEHARVECFSAAQAQSLGFANRTQWFIVRGAADPRCVAKGNAKAAQRYAPRTRVAGTRLSS
jgi:4-amino-4-deoxy-L-arabinose transferase-like glycosyltransferase